MLPWGTCDSKVPPKEPPFQIRRRVREGPQAIVFGLWRVCFPPVLIRTARRLPVEALRRGGVWVTVVVYYCRTYEKAVSGGGEREKGGHVLRDTTSRGLYVRFWPPHTSERRGGGGGCEQEGWQGGEGRARISRWAGVARAPSLSHTCGHTGRARRTVLDWVVLR
jgi:hypothetical protein